MHPALTIICLGPSQLLVYSAATNTGMHTIQQAHILYPATYIIAVASTQHHSRLQALGANACFDYKSPTIAKDVKALGKNVTRAIDCHSEGQSTVSCAQLMGNAGGKGPEGRIVRTLPPGMIQGTVPQGLRANEWIVSYTALGKVCPVSFRCPPPLHLSLIEHVLTPIALYLIHLESLLIHFSNQPFWFLFKYYPASPTDYAIASKNLKQLSGFLESGKVRTVRHRLLEGGLEMGIVMGFEEMKAGKVRGEKLVVEVGGER